MCSLGCFLCDLSAFAVRLTRPAPPQPKPWRGGGAKRFLYSVVISEKSTTQFAEGAISFNPQPTARNFNKPPRDAAYGAERKTSLSITDSELVSLLFPLRP